jgi:rfaE bifunctional protein kinase chain/domain
MQPTISRSRLVALLDAARGMRVAVVGDAMLDVYLRGDVDRISPEAPVPVVRVRHRAQAMGGAANVAQNVVALGARCELVAVVGDDIAGGVLRDLLRNLPTDPRAICTVGRPTTTKTRVLARSQQVVRFDEEEDEDISGTEIDGLLDVVGRAVADADAVVLEDYNKGVLVPRVIRRAIDGAKAKGIPVIVDPKYRHFFHYNGATIFKPNRRELENALGAAVELDEPAALHATLGRLGVEHMLLTLGEKGMALIEPDGSSHHVPTMAKAVYDVVGAGDTVSAYLAAMLAAGATALEAAIVANYAAGVEVGKLGAATVTAAEVVDAFDGR